MSLFKARDLWSVDLHCPDLFDSNSLLIAEFSGQTIVFVGCHDGYLRGYCPSPAFNPADLVYETLFPAPVLDLKLGSLVSGTQDKQLAVLHPRSLSVYHVQRFEDSNGTHITLRRAYQHTFNRSAFSFEVGTFGGLRGRDFVCVQSLDGQLSFFEQETATFVTQLPDVLLPTPFRYLQTTDSFIFLDANFYLNCYSYGSLSESERKKLTPSWTHNIGEFVIDITCVMVPKSGLNIIVLTERSLYDFNDQGKIVWMKRFEMRPICSYSFLNKTTNSVMTLLCTEFKDLQVYDCLCLKWCTKLDFIPVSLSAFHTGTLRGILALLSDSGSLQCIYLGTIPSLYLIPPVPEGEIKVFEAEEELKRLDAKIMGTDFGANFEDDTLTVKLTGDSKVNAEKQCTVTVELKSLTPVNKVQVAFFVEPPLICLDNCNSVVSVCDREIISIRIAMGSSTAPISNLEVTVVVSYALPNRVPRILQKATQCPFDVAVSSCAAAKEAPIKLTLMTNKPTCNLSEVFPGDDATANAVGLMFLNSSNVVTIIAAKTSQRYRIQAETAEDLALVLDHFVSKLKQQFRRVSDFGLSYSSPLPLQHFFEVVGRHFELVTRRRMRQEQLAQRTTQYRTIQKKILMSLKDLAPKPSTQLYTVLDDTYEMIKACVTELEMLELEMETSRCRINALCRLFITLLELTTISRTDLEHLRMGFACAAADGSEHGWLEIQNATLSLLLRTVLAKSSKDQNKHTDLSLDPLSDVSRLCKLFSTVVDRATKGTNLLERSEFDEERESLLTVPSVKEWETKEAKLVPRGSKMVDLTQKPLLPHKDASNLKNPPPTPEPNLRPIGQSNPIETQATIEIYQNEAEEVEKDIKEGGDKVKMAAGENEDQVKMAANGKGDKIKTTAGEENQVKMAAREVGYHFETVAGDKEEKRDLQLDKRNVSAASRDNIEDDAIWDIGLEEMTI